MPTFPRFMALIHGDDLFRWLEMCPDLSHLEHANHFLRRMASDKCASTLFHTHYTFTLPHQLHKKYAEPRSVIKNTWITYVQQNLDRQLHTCLYHRRNILINSTECSCWPFYCGSQRRLCPLIMVDMDLHCLDNAVCLGWTSSASTTTACWRTSLGIGITDVNLYLIGL